MKEQDRLWQLIAKKIAGEASERELHELQVLLQNNPGIQYFMETLSGEWKLSDQKDPREIEQVYSWHLDRMARKNAERERADLSRSKRAFSFTRFLNSGSMFSNYFKVIFRNLVRYKGFSLINISGLAVGMASAILILLWIQNDVSFDRFHEKKDRMYIAFNRAMFDGKLECWSGTPASMALALRSDFPQVESVVRINGTGPFIINVGDKHLEAIGTIADPDFLKLFSFPLLKGNKETALSSPRSMAVTERFAKKLFGDEDAMGKVVRIDSNAYFKVSAVLKNLPNNTAFDFEYLIPWSYMKEVGWERLSWTDNSIPTFVLLKPGVSEQSANDRIRDIIKKHADNVTNEVFLHPITKWHLYSRFENGKIAGGGIDEVRLFGIIAGFILLIACINYMNLSTAQSIKRAKEVGIRKVVGAGRRSIIFRFLGESIMVSLISVIVGLVIAHFGIAGFNWLTWKELEIPYSNLYFWLGIILFALFTGLLAGSYPAFYLSLYKPISVLKGTFKTGYNLINIRKILVVLQFSFAITFIICTIIIYRQIQYGSQRDPGYNRDHLVFAYINGEVNKRYHVIRQDLLNSGAVTSVTRSNSPISYTWSGDDSYTWTGSNPQQKTFFSEFHTDNDFLETMGLKIISGRPINTNMYPTDTTAVLLNESATKIMGFKDPVGQIIKNNQGTWTVVGVVKDFISGSPFFTVDPMIIQGPKNWFGAVTFKLNSQKSSADNMKKIEAIFKKYNPEYPFHYRFVDEADAEKFEGQKRTGVQSALFGGLAILISCLGLFALSAYTAENRIKEIGVRKVLGASVAGIATLLSKDFLKLVIIAFIIASPVAWWMMQAWLQHYTYRIGISWWIFVSAGFLSMLIAAATVSYQAIKAGLANPVISLRNE